MPLPNTTTVPPDDPTVALASEKIKMVVLGNRPRIASLADGLVANAAGPPRTVIWFKNGLPTALKTKFGIPNPDLWQAFTLSPTNDLRDQIPATSDADYIRLDQAFIEAAQ